MSHKVNGKDTFNEHFKHAFPAGYDLFSQLLIRTGLKKKKKRQISTTYSNISALDYRCVSFTSCLYKKLQLPVKSLLTHL